MGGTSDGWAVPHTPPRDIVQGDDRSADLITGPLALSFIHTGQLRENQNLIDDLVS